MKKFGVIYRFETIRTLKRPAFWVAISFAPLLIAVLAFVLGYSINTVAESVSERNRAQFTFIDQSHLINPVTANLFGGTPAPNASYEGQLEQEITRVKQGQSSALLIFPSDPAVQVGEIYVNVEGLSANVSYSTIYQKMLVESVAPLVNNASYATILEGAIATEQTVFRQGVKVDSGSELLQVAVFLGLFLLVIVSMAGPVLNSSTEEKENRVGEQLLAKTSATAWQLAKLASVSTLVFLQVGLYAITVIVSYQTFADRFNLPALENVLGFTSRTFTSLGLLFAGIILLATTLTFVGNSAGHANSANSTSSAFVVLPVLPLYAFSMLVSDPQNSFAQVLSYFPYTASATGFITNAASSTLGFTPMIAIAIMLITASGTFVWAIRIAKKRAIGATGARRRWLASTTPGRSV